MADPTRSGRTLVAYGPYCMVALVAVVAVVTLRHDGTALGPCLALLAGLAAWMLGVFTLHPAWRDRPVVMSVFVAVVLAFIAALVLEQPWFGVLAIAGYIYSFSVVPWPWRLISVALCAVFAATAQASDVDKGSASGVAIYAAIIALNMVALCLFAWINWTASLQSEQRRMTLEENAALHEQLLLHAREAGVQQERQRLAQEIHDTIAQGLVGIVTQLQAAERTDGPETRRHLDAAITLARQSLGEARRSVQALQPELLEGATLAEALAVVVRRWEALHGASVGFAVTGDASSVLSDDAEAALLRVAQESLANVAQHARAGRVGVTLTRFPQEVALDVRDDGVGFAADALGAVGAVRAERGGSGRLDGMEHGGFGLTAMRQRLAAVGGRLEVETAPGRGTVVTAVVPVSRGGLAYGSGRVVLHE